MAFFIAKRGLTTITPIQISARFEKTQLISPNASNARGATHNL
jgi:hypothetical protein